MSRNLSGRPRRLLFGDSWRRRRPEAFGARHRVTRERCPPDSRLDVREVERESLPLHPGDDMAEPLSVVEPLAHELNLLRRWLPPRVEEREAEGGSEERAAAGEVGSHSTILVAWRITEGGTVKPSALAVLRLRISRNFAGCSMGRSPGRAPLRILST